MVDILLAGERQNMILERLEADGRVLATELARELRISEDTVRRDLRDLASAGRCRRVYGGALPISPASGPLSTRRQDQAARKDLLGRAAARLIGAIVRPGGVVFIDAGSTNLAVAGALAGAIGLTVVTNAPSIAEVVGGLGIGVEVIGGRLDPRSGALVGARALREVMEVRADLAVIGACALDASAGLTAFDAEEAAIKRAASERSGAVLCAATADKIGTGAPFFVLPVGGVTHLVTEARGAAVGALQEAGVAVHGVSGDE